MRNYNIIQATQGVPVAGKPTPIDLETNWDTRFLICTVRAVATISVASATAIRNGGSVLAIFDRVRISESGKDTLIGDPRLLGFASEFLRGAPGTRTRQTVLTVGATNLVERFMIPFERLVQAMPRETRYRVRNKSLKFQLIFETNATPEARLFTVGGATVVISAMTIDVRQYVARDNDQVAPIFLPRWTQMDFAVPAGASPDLRAELDIGSDFLAGVTALQETDTTGIVTDILNNVQFRTDERIFIGENGKVKWADLAADQEWVAGGNVFAADNGGIVHFDFRDAGRHTHMIDPGNALKLRYMFDAQASASAGTSRIRLLLHRLSRDEAVAAGGRRLVAPEIPYPV